jgi:hypothetical protein
MQPNVEDRVFPTLVRATECLSHHPYFRDRGAHRFSFSRQRSGTATIAYRFEAALAQTRKSYWLKIYRSNPKDALKEWQFLNEAVAGAGANRPLPMARPIAYLGEFAALVTEHAEGEMLAARSRHFLQNPDRPAGDDADRACRMAGEWLAQLHERQIPNSHQPAAALLQDIEDRAKRAHGAEKCGAAFKDRIVDLAHGLVHEISPADLSRVRTHGDYGPFNIVIGGEAALVLDPSFEESVDRFANYCSRYEDLARFFVYIGGALPPDASAPQRERMLSGFVAGYNAGAGQKMDRTSPAFIAFRLKYRLQALIDWWPRPGCEPSQMVHDW